MNREIWQERTRLLLGKDKTEKLHNAHILVAGLGGVGAYAAEMLVRAGIGKITIVDSDVVNPSNLNRQLLALKSTLGQPKSEIMKARLLEINPELEIQSLNI
ncbi:MAG: tRNA threonylcarbamoyladenosine dehydratase, partial [Bacteroidales bacterium]|nr:tRNA threonylcarbamoyladenosine dehydratase [Bacteroidales bacterium]